MRERKKRGKKRKGKKSKCSEQGQTVRKRSRDRKETPVHLVSHAHFIWNTAVESLYQKKKKER